jgi:hypothetical protein
MDEKQQREMIEATERFAAAQGGYVDKKFDDKGKLVKIGVRFKGGKKLGDMPAISKFLATRPPDKITDEPKKRLN